MSVPGAEPPPPPSPPSPPSVSAVQLRALLDAMVAIGSDLDLDAVLLRVAETAVRLVGASYGALGVVDGGGSRLAEFVTVGIDAPTRVAIGDPPRGHGVLGRLLVDPRPVRVSDISGHPESFGFPPHHPIMTSFLGVPIIVRREVFGTLYLADKVDGGPGDADFTDTDLELIVGLASAAAVAIDNARLHVLAREVDLAEDRERIARELHDTVIQRLFATGLSLQAATRLIERPEAVDRIQRCIDDLDETVRQIRSAIFDLNEPPPEHAGDLRTALRGLVGQWSEQLGFEPTLRLDGPLDTMVSPAIAEHALAVVGEGLANVARHARATDALVRAEIVAGSRLRIAVEDGGVGPVVATTHGRGLVDVIDRAEALGGSATFGARRGGGSALNWTVPLNAAGAS